MTDLILFGMQGSGKGTQGQILAKKLEAEVFEMGGQLRKLAMEESELAKKVKAIMEAGNLVPTEVIMEIISAFLTELSAEKTVIFDGIPRSEEQRKQFEEAVTSAKRKPIAIYIHLTREEALKRLLGRRTCSVCKTIYGAKDNLAEDAACPACGGELKVRADDTQEAIETRLATYERETLPVIEKYRAEERLIEVDGAQNVEAVSTAIIDALESR